MRRFPSLLIMSILSAVIALSCGLDAQDPLPDGDDLPGDIDWIWDGDTPRDGDVPDGDRTDGDGSDGDLVDGDEPDGDLVDGDEDGDGEDAPGPVLDVPVQVDFGLGELNRTLTRNLTIRNLGEENLVVTTVQFAADCTPEFGINTQVDEALVIEPGLSDMILLSYRMADIGEDGCNLLIASNDPRRPTASVWVFSSYTGSPSVYVVPQSMAFGNWDIHADAAQSRVVTFTHIAQPGSNAILTLGPFRIENTSLPYAFDDTFNPNQTHLIKPGDSLYFPVLFRPTAKGLSETRLLFDTNDESFSSRAEGAVSLTGRGVAAEIQADPVSLAFGTKPVGFYTEQPVMLSNIGEATAHIQSVEIVGGDGFFTYVPGSHLSSPIPPGQDVVIHVGYEPTQTGVHTALLRVTGQNFHGTNPVDITLSGTAVVPSWDLSANAIAFGAVPVFTSTTRTLTITNTAQTPLVIRELLLSGDSAFTLSQGDLDLLPVTLTPGDSTFTVHVNFRPVSRQMRSANLEVSTDDDLVPSRDVTLSGQGAAPRMAITRADSLPFTDEIFFGLTRIGEEKTVELVVGNSGSVDLLLTDIVIDPPAAVVFAVSDASLTVPFGQTRTLTVTYRPVRPPSTDSADLRFGTNDPDRPLVAVALGGAGIDPVMSLGPETSEEEPFVFGKQQAGPDASYGPRQFIVTNQGEGPLTIESLSLDEGMDEGFRLAFPSGAPPFDVDPLGRGASQFVFHLYFEPRHPGLYAGRATLRTNDLNKPVTHIWFSGEGDSCPDGLHDPDDSGECWYACEYSEGGIEVCDGLDNNCDAETDEGYNIGVPCEGKGECGTGAIECHPDNNQFTVCSTDPGGSQYPNPAPSERCDGRDNNCDGRTDEGFSLGSPCTGLGICGAGVLQCDPQDSTRTLCSTNPGGQDDQSEPDLCDGLDNDCDGHTDEDFPNLGAVCDGVGECGTGRRVCHPSNLTLTMCSTDIGGPDYVENSERCNFLDDNCDGNTDEGLGLGQACTPPGICGPGVRQCNPSGNGETLCSTGPGGTSYGGYPELCDGLDNDCDGETDEDFALGTSCPGQGVCGAGVWECHPTRPQERVCSTLPGGSLYPDPPPVELCDGLDNTCNGQTDETFALGAACDGVGACGAGVKECHPTDSARVICSTDLGGSASQSVPESCDGLDNDCDGHVDNGFDIGTPCQGQGSACIDGRIECATLSTVRCSTDEGGSNWPTPEEVCDGVDNNCDGQTDEGWNVGEPCLAPGECGAGLFECDPGNVRRVICDTEPGGSEDRSGPELCDGLDNNCNWLTDEPFQLGQACTGIGECGSGTWECASLTLRRCSSDLGGSDDQSDPERCDGLDNDCDGTTDNGFNLGQPCSGVGACGAGVRECDPSDPGRAFCSTDVGGSADGSKPETCDGIDEDCDGLTDEDFHVGESCEGTGECGAGVLECNGPQATRCSTNPGGTQYVYVAELCDGLDNDCNGQTDEPFSVGASCVGVGACGAGTRECLDLQTAICSTDIGGSEYPDPSPEEVCDGIDNDCDGQTDEGFNLGAVCVGAGECGEGVFECNGDGGVCCSSDFGGSDYPEIPYTEFCDGLDNNCNGLTDEDFDVGGLCAGTGVCGDGVWECTPNGGRLCSTHLGGSEWEGSPERCDGLDNDCDGATDEDFHVGLECVGKGVCGVGLYECDLQGDVVCSTEPGGSNPQDGPERCNGLDDNCNGFTDEDFNIGESCVGRGICGEGVLECATLDTTRCSTEHGGSADESEDEICDTLDNNCDGVTDEGFDVGEPCAGVGQCPAGTLECTPTGGQVCSTNPGGSLYPNPAPVELCDGLDNNCNGETDEGLGAGLPCFGIGECADNAGLTECGPDLLIICSTSFGGSQWAGSSEVCDELDNDCDGQTDEDFGIGESCTGTGECSPYSGVWICWSLQERICSVNAHWHPNYSGIPELCNDLDDDCDGLTDETFTLLGQSCMGLGECGPGVRICDPTYPLGYICSTDSGGPEYGGEQEHCDGLDNDCDGFTDEDWQIGGVCNGRGRCSTAFGSWVCDGESSRICSTDLPEHPAYAGIPETCNYLDDDCDGQTDEVWPDLGSSCQTGGGCGEGYIECNAQVDPACQAQVYCSKDPTCGSQREGGFEVCNGLDDDCNGCTDDGFTRDGSCQPIPCVGIGVCGAGVLECAGFYTTRCSTNPGGGNDQSGPELCDGLDNNCNGQTDETFQIGTSCTGVGACGPGTWECDPQDSSRRLCSSDIGGSDYPNPPPVEVCNGLDDDCDGQTDEGFDVGQLCMGMGECGQGVLECNHIGGVRCSTEYGGSRYQGQSERCNDLDDNCNGLTDEDFGIYDPQTGLRVLCEGAGACGFGVMECLTETVSICCADVGGSCYDVSDETCDGRDNNCNGFTDELWPQLGQSCVGVGACGAGVYECRFDGSGVQCSSDQNGSSYGGSPEICDGIDNNCNGLTDEPFGVGNDFPCVGRGVCGPGYFECDPADPEKRQRICDVDIGGSRYAGTADICDGLDNNCNGQTDEGFHIGEFCKGTGECRLGSYECASPSSYRCSTNPGGSADDSIPEICDGKDNDCDGLTDEDFPVNQSCMSPGICGAGVVECDEDHSVRCSSAMNGSAYIGTPELCDGLDNDCDGSTDEDFEIGDPCCTVAGACGECGGPGAGGVWECRGLEARKCSVGYLGSQSQSEPETCDGKDNDCDGLTDEGFGVGGPCQGTGACGAGTFECTQTGQVICSSNPGGSGYQTRPELCDGIDNDCDGQTDEGFNIGASCTGVGQCGTGVRECATVDTTRCSVNPGGSAYAGSPEVCDSLDNDCDGFTDEDFYTTPSCVGAGECGPGVWVCTGPYMAVCSSQIPTHPHYNASPEICDGKDNDCNGQTDDGLGLGTPCVGTGACGAGVIECGPGNQPVCSSNPGGSQSQATPEVCDNIDNNCDGQTDEGFLLGLSCNGNGDCGEGTRECDCPLHNPFCGSTRARCSTDFGGSEYIGGEEVCDYRDNDCDGLTDEDWNLGSPCVGKGICGAGVLECKYGLRETLCSTDLGGSNYRGTTESCNGLDDDCDGLTDENYLVGQPCDGVGECGTGVYECNGLNAFRCSTNPGGSAAQNHDETCDGLDNDCDGAIDNGFPTKGTLCTAQGVCGQGVWECAGPMTLRCSTSIGGSGYTGSLELCNGLDDDCDGQTDEDFKCNTALDPDCNDRPYLDATCNGIGECGIGVFECANLYELRCSRDIGGIQYDGHPETCNGLDDDCDGLTDETFPIGEECTGVGQCGPGVRQCDPNNAAQTICSTDIGGADYPNPAPTETCNYLDDDCDGFTDELWASLGQPCLGGGGCGGGGAIGIYECRADQLGYICSTDPGGSEFNGGGPELCDGVDNNCNGSTDEGFNLGAVCTGVGQCGAGTLECNASNRTISMCSTMPGGTQNQATQEICDGLDNNCNGLTDEYWPTLGQSCSGIGACGQGVWECNGNYNTRCSTRVGGSAYPDPPPDELCNGLDDDCDGLTDEGFFLGQVCQGLGACGAGVLECATTTTTRCSTDFGGSAYEPSPELCDGMDNDCDGFTDEDFTLGVPCDGMGVCQTGLTECNATGSGTRCSTLPGGSASQASSEICDGLDNNCNGQIDEGFGVYANPSQWAQTGCIADSGCPQGQVCIVSQGICIVPVTCPGVGACASGRMECATSYTVVCSTQAGGSQYTGTAELCNGLDDDCDGLTDENYQFFPPWPSCTTGCGSPLGTYCEGLGECGVGQWECAADGIRTRCSARSYTDGRGNGSQFNPAPQELCDGLDNTCDGQVDEGFNLGASCTGLGQCGQGVLECATLSTTRCSTMPGGSQSQATVERCDGLDNNCNGVTDENFSLGDPCMGLGECGPGIMECAGTHASQCSTNPGGSQYMPMPELCDGLDNDCDGLTDENWPNKGQACVAPGDCGTGYWQCRSDQLGVRCSALDNAETEVCDGIDNDCDGLTDEGFSIGNGCAGVGACGPGVIECASLDTTRCSSDLGGSQYMGTPEVCDSIDNDCDGFIDEDYKDGSGLYNSEQHCGACNTTCDFPNSDASCSNGACVITSCDSGWYDLDQGATNGCECKVLYSGGPVCGESIAMPGGELQDVSGGQQTTVKGQILSLDGEMWFTFFARDTVDTFCDLFSIHIRLSVNPLNAFKLDVYRDGCGPENLSCLSTDQYRFRTDSVVSPPLGECPCSPETGDVTEWPEPRSYPNYCDDQSAQYHVRVRYSPTATNVTCSAFTLAATNAR